MTESLTSNLEVALSRLRNPEGESWVTLREAEAAALLAELERRAEPPSASLEGTTPRPWSVRTHGEDAWIEGNEVVGHSVAGPYKRQVLGDEQYPAKLNDAKLIVAAVNAYISPACNCPPSAADPTRPNCQADRSNEPGCRATVTKEENSGSVLSVGTSETPRGAGGHRGTTVETSARECTCYECSSEIRRMTRMITCAKCGNKRCPHATNHIHECTGSNEPGQPGSRYQL